MNVIADLRSDKMSKPTESMRLAMAEADIGNGRFRNESAVDLLERRIAEMTGKESACYMASGTVSNEIALRAYVRFGHFAVAESDAYICDKESRSAAALPSVAFHRLPARSHGILEADQVAEALMSASNDIGVIDLVTIENTHQLGGGSVMPVHTMAAIADVSAARGVPVYLDGARLFNACVATGTAVADYAIHADSLAISLSKGLGGPAGSVLAGDAAFVREARRLKVAFGGASSRADVMAAAGLVALEEGPQRLTADHRNAQRLAAGVAEVLPGSVVPADVTTNVVLVDVSGTGRSPGEWVDRLADEGILTADVRGRVKMLTHLDVTAADIEAVIAAWRCAAADLPLTGTRAPSVASTAEPAHHHCGVCDTTPPRD